MALRILLADNHETFRRTFADFLRTQPGIETVCDVGDGDQAIEQANELTPDIVFLDLHMPKRNGFEASKAIKRLRANTKVFIVSAEDAEIYKEMAAMNDADGYIDKRSVKGSVVDILHSMLLRVSVAEAA